MDLQYLDFDFSGDAHGQGSFDAMASVDAAQLKAVDAEIRAVLDWAQRSFGPAAALDDGGEWDYALQGVWHVDTQLTVRYAPDAGCLDMKPGELDPPRVTLTLTVTGTDAFCSAMREAFAIA